MTDAAFRAGRGTVAGFDDHRGDGTIRGGDGSTWWFHCTQIADGTRTIEAGTPVTFLIRAGRLGRWEAADVRPLAGG